MDIDIFLKPTGTQFSSFPLGTLGSMASFYKEDSDVSFFEQKHIAILGVEEERGAENNEGCAHGPDVIREHFYALYPSFHSDPKVIDLGNIKKGQSLEDTFFAVSEVCSFLIKKNIIPVVLGGGHHLTYALYKSYERLEQIINMVSIDKKLDLDVLHLQEDTLSDIDNDNFLNYIISHQPSHLFNYTQLAYQKYFESAQALQLMSKLHFDTLRLGDINGNQLSEIEPILRNADVVSVDISCVRYSDAPANKKSSPHGLYGEELCQLLRYAGMGDRVACLGFFEYNPTLDGNNFQTAQLIAQSMWYFLEGYYIRKTEYPASKADNFLKYRVVLEENAQEIIFFKSILTDRWWMEVPYPSGKASHSRHYLVPCSYQDYQKACQDGIPERWWKTFQKLM